MKKIKRLEDVYRFPGFRPARLHGVFGDPQAVMLRLKRRGKKRCAETAGRHTMLGMTIPPDGSVTCPAGINGHTWNLRYDGLTANGAVR
jgi:hypothetical protein